MLDFLCIGAQKAGTSWLHWHFSRHPQISFPAGKEVHFWDWAQRGKLPLNHERYREKFPDNPRVKQGDMTPAYALLEPSYIRELHGMYPNVRILVVLRDPVERAWSAAKMLLDYAQIEPQEIGDDWLLGAVMSEASLARGDYEMTLRRWHDVYGADQIEVLLYDDVIRDPHGLLARCAKHLRVDPGPFMRIRKEALNRPIKMGITLPMPVRVRNELTAYYRPKLESLARYLEMKLPDWCPQALDDHE